MRNLFVCLTAALVVAGCSSEMDRPLASAKPGIAPIHTPIARAVAQATDRSAFASLPDRGTLMAFDTMQAPVRNGATTLYPVRLSEAHALNAAGPGRSIAIPTASGETMDFTYASHTEDTLGNWTWVGKTRQGLSAVITFGEDAVFGQIDLPGSAPLQLITRQGRSWLGVIDPSKAKLGHLLREGRADYLIPNALAKTATTLGTSKAQPLPGIVGKASPANTVDVLLGYTPGMVTSYSTVSAVNTRLTNLVAISNQAYERSQVTPRIRLVHTMQVNYTDTNKNDDALSQLSGYVCNPNCTTAPVPAELVPLRNAREQYGADLVSLVRPLRAPQHEGCGIAWLVGGDQDAIDNSYAPFGYSVVSDGEDVNETDNLNYLCYVETLAHELGHNMGQAHNTQNASQPGAHSYSYGYRETSTTGFFTIMAYPLDNSSQFPIAYFGNPNVNDAGTGRVTGTAAADNARSLNLTMPLVAQFRAAVVPFAGKARNDFNGDGRSEIYWRNTSTGANSIWVLNGATATSIATVHTEPDQAWKVFGFGDFNADGRSDVFWRNTTTGQTFIHMMNGNTAAAGSLSRPEADLNWVPVAFGDFDGDGDGDIYWRNSVSGACVVWYMQGFLPQTIRFIHTEPSASWVIVGATDFNSDGISDILWHNSTTGFVYMHIMSATGVNGAASGGVGTVSDLNWRIAALDDFNGDGRGDIYWRNQTTGANYLWALNGLNLVLGQGLNVEPDLNWKIAATGDFNGDGRADVFWRHGGNGSNYVHLMNGAAFLPGSTFSTAQPGQAWQVIATSPFGG